MVVEALFDISEPGESPDKEACKGRAAGIDLGTTNSLVAVVKAGQPVCLPGTETTLVPSVVSYDSGGELIVGQAARERAARYPRDTIASVKRFMGRGPDDAEARRAFTPYEFAPGGGDGVVRFAVAGRPRGVTPMEVSAEILRVLKGRAEADLGGPLDGVVITVPAYFDDGQRQATRDAGRLAGLEVLRLLNEPTAAALAYGLDRAAEGTFAVFDLGGGTFDVSILKLEGGVFEVKSTGGDSALGGDDFDRAIAGHLLAEAGFPPDGGGDPLLVRQVLDLSRTAKEALTDAASVAAVIRSEGSEILWSGTLSREAMERLVQPVLARCAPAVRRALKDADLTPTDLSGVILVGGATRMPLVRRFVRDLFGQEPLADIDPDEVVALGAAVQADMLAGSARSDVVLLDVVPLSLGLEMMGGVVEKLIHRNTTIPCGASQTFTTYVDNQTGFNLHVLQGERELVNDCRSLARFTLGGIPPMPAGMARLEVTFLVDADGLLRVSAREETTGKESSIQVKPTYGLTDDEVDAMLMESYTHAAADVAARQLTEQRVEGERILAATRAAMHASPELLTEADRAAIAAAITLLETAKAGHDHLAIRAAVEGLDLASKEFASRRMNRALEKGLAGRGVDDVAAHLHRHPSPQG